MEPLDKNAIMTAENDHSAERVQFTFDLTMILPIRCAAPETGVIDLLGPPW